MKSQSIVITFPQRFTITLACSSSSIDPSAIISHLLKFQILTSQQCQQSPISLYTVKNKSPQLASQITPGQTYYLCHEHQKHLISDLLMSMESEQSQQMESNAKVDDHEGNGEIIFRGAQKEGGKGDQAIKIEDRMSFDMNELKTEQIKNESLDQFPKRTKSQMILSRKTTKPEQTQSQIFTASKKKSGLLISKLISNSNIFKRSDSGVAMEENPVANVTFMLDGKVLKESKIKKMSVIKDDQIMKNYDVFLDEGLKRPLKKNVTMIFWDKVLYCRLKMKMKTDESMGQMGENEWVEENPEQTKKNFKVHKKKPILKLRHEEEKEEESRGILNTPGTIFHIRKSAIKLSHNNHNHKQIKQ